MEKFDELASARNPQALPLASAQPLSWPRKHWDILAVVLLMLAALPTLWLSPRTLIDTGSQINLVEESWILDTSFKASRGLWFGQDVAFTYGPLYQWLSSAPSRWTGISMGAIFDSCVSLPLWCTFLFGYFTLVLLLPEQPAWKRFVLLLLLCIFWAPVEGRIAFVIFLFAAFLRGWYAVRRQVLAPVLAGCSAALLCAVAFLYSTDTGVYTLAAFVLSLAGVAWEDRRDGQLLRSYGPALVAFSFFSLVLVLVVNAFLAKPLDFRFWKNSLAILGSYRWIEPVSISRAGTLHLLGALLVAGVVFLMRAATARNRDRGIAARSSFLLSAFALSCLTMQSGLVRSDWGHIVVSTYATVFLTGVVLFSFASRMVSALTFLLVVTCSLMFGEPPSLVTALRYNYTQLRSPSTTCPSRFMDFDHVCYPGEFVETLQHTVDFLQQHSGPGDFMAVFPFHNIFGVASRRNVAGGVLQSYLVSGPYLSQVDIAGLERAAAPVGLYLPDSELSQPIDEVPNFTRSPDVWLWMFRHYRKEQELVPRILGLERDDLRADTMAMQTHPLNAAAHYPIPTRDAVLDLGGITWPVDNADFLRLRLKVHYPLWWKLRKPARLVLKIERADSSDDLKPFIVEPNVSSDVWFYPWNQADLAHYFDAEEGRWRTSPRPAITHLRLLVTPLDWVSVQPDMIEVQAADAITFRMARATRNARGFSSLR
jgi:hypothetical protein